jgi:hypothetical protein
MTHIYLYTCIYGRKLDDQGCETALLSMASVSRMNCVRETFDEVTGEGTYVMTLSNYPIAPPFMNNIIYHDGRPTERLFSCNVSRIDHEEASSPYCRVSIIEPFEGLPLYAECSNHGVCDKVVGKCACERGFKGEACNDIRDAEVGRWWYRDHDGDDDEYGGGDDDDDYYDDSEFSQSQLRSSLSLSYWYSLFMPSVSYLPTYVSTTYTFSQIYLPIYPFMHLSICLLIIYCTSLYPYLPSLYPLIPL